jgi:hypothetical protein
MEKNLLLAVLLMVVGWMMGIFGLSFLEVVPIIGNALFLFGLVLAVIGVAIWVATMRNLRR